ncbi:hypothetical protein [Tindallia californiensis]|uniref:Uncharacterized protein n=1 Tax=Tindallia californiensis TaxID=159292 RepID=A0A1H3PFE6_9FIRM|nr:hypothetical protein [Tindallia californiensis]SDY99892.1 hypothetical protein SAMN05192546_106185 [Tindallia californiensis]
MKEEKKQGIVGGVQFIIDIRYLQNYSWQGSLQRLDTGEKIHFRSHRELILLMESVLEQHEKTEDRNETLRQWKKTFKEVVSGKTRAIQ